MSDKIKDGGAAFPIPVGQAERETCTGRIVMEYSASQAGMTLRDYFAAKAMVAIESHVKDWPFDKDWVAEEAYSIADAMIAERAKTTK